MTIAAILGTKGGFVASINASATVAEAAQMLATHRVGALPVVDGDDIVGMLSERDIVRGVATSGAGVLEAMVASVMTAPAVTAVPGDPVLAALSLMTQRRIRHLPVVDDGRIAGIVSIGDLVKYRIDRIEAEAAAMRQYIQG